MHRNNHTFNILLKSTKIHYELTCRAMGSNYDFQYSIEINVGLALYLAAFLTASFQYSIEIN